MKPARVLVTDGEVRTALSVVRSLGDAGHEVVVTASQTPSIAGSSRRAVAEERVPDSLADPGSFVDRLEQLCRRREIDVLLPVSDEALTAVLPERRRFEGVRIPFPPYEVFRRISDKRAVMGVARRIGIPVPEQQVLTAPHGRALDDAASLPFPVVVKPSRSVARVDGSTRKLRVRSAADPDGLLEALRSVPEAGYPVLVQRRIVGSGSGIFLLLHDGDPAAVFAHRRIREQPPSGGVSVYRESVRPDPDALRHSVDLLSAFGWEGVAMVEFKVEEETGTHYLMEVNGRFWGSLQLAVDAGVDFPRLLVRSGLDEPLPPPPEYREGVRLQWILGDVDHLIARFREPDAIATGDDGDGGRWSALKNFVASWRPGVRRETLRITDPAPFLRETLKWSRSWMKRF